MKLRLNLATLIFSTALFLNAAGAVQPAYAAAVGDALDKAQQYTGETLSIVGTYWNDAWSGLKSWLPSLPTAGSLLGENGEDAVPSELDFERMMDLAGYATKSISIGVGIIPETELNFAQKRQMSEYDREYLVRLLRKHERERSGPKAIAERAVIETVLEIQSFKKYDLTRISVKLLPLPSVTFTAEPKDFVLDPDASYVLREIEQLNLKLEEIASR